MEEDDYVYITTPRRSLKVPAHIAKYIRPVQAVYQNGYWIENGAVQDLDKRGEPIEHKFIGSNVKIPKRGSVPKEQRQDSIDKANAEVRAKYWNQAPIISHAVDSIAKRYGISSALLRHRLNEEGFTDKAIKLNNKGKDSYSYNALHTNFPWFDENGNPGSPGFYGFGLDDGATMILDGRVKPINEKWTGSDNINEFGREVHTSDGKTNADNIGLTAAALRYFRDKAAMDFPNASRKTLDEAAGYYYNMGAKGGKNYMKKLLKK